MIGRHKKNIQLFEQRKQGEGTFIFIQVGRLIFLEAHLPLHSLFLFFFCQNQDQHSLCTFRNNRNNKRINNHRKKILRFKQTNSLRAKGANTFRWEKKIKCTAILIGSRTLQWRIHPLGARPQAGAPTAPPRSEPTTHLSTPPPNSDSRNGIRICTAVGLKEIATLCRQV